MKKKSFVEMGEYYLAELYGLVRTVCRAYHYESGEAMIAYVKIKSGGYSSEIFFMPETEFKNIFLS